MSPAPSNSRRPRRNDEMKFAYAGPFVRLLDPIRPVKPERGPSGIILRKQPTYSADSAESWTVRSALAIEVVGELAARFSPFDSPTSLTEPNRPKRRGRRGGRKQVRS